MVELVELSIRLYGELRELAPELDSTTSTVGKMRGSFDASAAVSDILRRLGLEIEDVSHIFVDGKYSGLNRKLEGANKVAIFPADMGLLYSWYFEEKE